MTTPTNHRRELSWTLFFAVVLTALPALALTATISHALAPRQQFPTRMVTMSVRTPTPAVPTATPAAWHPVAKGVSAFPDIPEAICHDAAAVGASWQVNGWTDKDCPFVEEIGAGIVPGTSPIVIAGPNEPDAGAGIPPCTAALEWHDLIEPTYTDKGLAGPGIAVWPRGWMPLFWSCFEDIYGRAPRMQYLTVHCYSDGQRDCLAELAAAAAWAQTHDLQVIVSEYAALVYGNPFHCDGGCNDCQTETNGLAEARRVLDGLHYIPGIAAVAWYNTRTPGDDPGAMDCNSPLIDSEGELTVFGRFYRDWR
jgi:hypothetical protein